MSKVQTTPREELRQGIRELWTAAKSGTRLDKQKSIRKIKNAVEREERIMLNRIQVEEFDDELDGLTEQIEVAEALAAGEPLTGEAPVTEVIKAASEEAADTERPKRRGGRRKVEPLGITSEKPKRGGRRKPNDDGSGQPLALNGNGHANGHVTLTPGQLSRLWEIVTGGQVGIQVQGETVTCWVSESSFRKALPELLNRL